MFGATVEWVWQFGLLCHTPYRAATPLAMSVIPFPTGAASPVTVHQTTSKGCQTECKLGCFTLFLPPQTTTHRPLLLRLACTDNL